MTQFSSTSNANDAAWHGALQICRPIEELPYRKYRQHLTFARMGISNPLSIDNYVAHGGLEVCGTH
jgi:hypothetical protein